MEIKVDKINYKKYKDISFNVVKNTIVGIYSKQKYDYSLLDLISGLVLPKAGKIVIDNCKINKKNQFDKNELSKKVSYFNEDMEMFYNKKIKDIIKKIFDLKKVEYTNEDIKNAFNKFEINEDITLKKYNELSDGEKCLIRLIINILLDTDIILIDEPTVFLDSKKVKMVIRILKDLKNNCNKTIIINSVDIELLHKLCDQIIIINDGSILLNGNKYEVFTNEDLLKQYNIPVPNVVEFSNLVLKTKGIRIGYRDEINDLMKDIYRYVR